MCLHRGTMLMACQCYHGHCKLWHCSNAFGAMCCQYLMLRVSVVSFVLCFIFIVVMAVLFAIDHCYFCCQKPQCCWTSLACCWLCFMRLCLCCFLLLLPPATIDSCLSTFFLSLLFFGIDHRIVAVFLLSKPTVPPHLNTLLSTTLHCSRHLVGCHHLLSMFSSCSCHLPLLL